VSLYATFDIGFSLPKVAGLIFGIGVFYAVVEWSASRSRFAWALAGYLLLGGALAAVGLLGAGWVNKVPVLKELGNLFPRLVQGLPGAESGIHPNELAGALLWVVPLQVALIPIYSDFTALGINGKYLAVWLAHTGFGLSLAIYLLYNYVSQLPRDLFESAFIDGASPFTVFVRLVLPLSVPALASFAIFQFLWVWNDYLVALIFLGGTEQTGVLTVRLAGIVGSFGRDWHLLTAGAFVSMLVPLIVFFSLQRFFVRGLLAGSVKG
jgi:ABC-type sugar transport system permease subunit